MGNFKYCKEFEVHYYEINKFREASPVSILNYLEETAICHSWSVGLGFERLYEKGYAWVLAKWHVDIIRLPLFKEKILVETWPSSFDRYFAERWFSLKDEKGNIIIKAASLWVLLDINKKKAVRIPEEISSCYTICNEIPSNNPFISFDKTGEIDSRKQFYIRRSDIDTNNHVNNKKYVDWALETIPDNVFENYYLASLDVLYKKDTSYGSSVYSGCREIIKDISHAEFYHSILQADNLSDLCLIYTKWNKR